MGTALSFLVKHKKAIIQFLIALGVAVLLYKGGKSFLGWLNGGNGYEDQPQPPQANLTYPRVEYKGMADRMEGALGLFNRDVDAVNDILDKMLTRDDLKQLIISFGSRSAFSIWFDNDKRNLVQWLQKRLYSGEMESVAEKFNQLGVPV